MLLEGDLWPLHEGAPYTKYRNPYLNRDTLIAIGDLDIVDPKILT